MTVNTKDYWRALAIYKAGLVKKKVSGTASAVVLLVYSDALTEMERELGKNASRVALLWGQDIWGPGKWLRNWHDFFSKKHEPQLYDQRRYQKKYEEYLNYSTFMIQRSQLWRRHIIDYKNNTHWVDKFSPQLKAVIGLSMTELMKWALINEYQKDYLTWKPERGLQQMLSERPDLVTALRIAQIYGIDARKYPIRVEKRPWYVEVIEIGISFVPIVGNLVAAYEAEAGHDLFGYNLDPIERAILAGSVLLPFAGRMVKGGRALYTSRRMGKLYGRDAKTWSRMMASGERLSSNPEALRVLRQADESVRGRKPLGNKLAKEVDGAMTKVRPGKVAATSTTSVSRKVKDAFAKLSGKYKVIDELDELAIQRVIESGPSINHMKGQLLEELLETRVVKFLQDPHAAKALGINVPTHELRFIPGHLVRDASGRVGRQITDGILVRKVKDGLEILGIFEAKAGKSAARELKATSTSINKMSDLERAELRAFAKDEYKELLEQARLDGTKVTKNIDQIEKEIIKTEHGGQVRRDIERLDQNVGGAAIKIRIGGVETPIKVSATRTRIFGVLPKDLRPEFIAKLKADVQSLHYNFDIFGIDITTKQLKDIAKELSKLLP